MANYITYIGDQQFLLEAPAEGAFAKSASEVSGDPRTALATIIEQAKLLASSLGKEIGPALRATGAGMDIAFAIRADLSGTVMVSEDTKKGQFVCTLRFPPMRPTAAPRRPQPAQVAAKPPEAG